MGRYWSLLRVLSVREFQKCVFFIIKIMKWRVSAYACFPPPTCPSHRSAHFLPSWIITIPAQFATLQSKRVHAFRASSDADWKKKEKDQVRGFRAEVTYRGKYVHSKKAHLNQLCGLLSEYFHRSIIQAVYLFMPTTQKTSWTNMPGQGVLCAKDYRRRGKRWCQIGRSKLLRRQSHRRLSLQYKGGRSNAVRQEQEVVQASTRSTSFSSQGCY